MALQQDTLYTSEGEKKKDISHNMLFIGNAHIDPVWLWQWREGYHEVRATFRSALDRMNENKDFFFTCACACYYQWVEKADPDMFEEIRRRVKEGRWILAGGMWIQPDMNTPSGESLCRQLLYSQRYFEKAFGQHAEIGYNVDSFGHNAMIPQLLRKAGIYAYVWMRPSIVENPAIPQGPMFWIAPDGSCVSAYRIEGEYTCAHNIAEKSHKLLEFGDKIGQKVMCFYGVGNHGGGPTIENLRQIDAFLKEDPRGREAAYGSAKSYFDELFLDYGLTPQNTASETVLHETGLELEKTLPIWKGELQHHASGCYSTHSRSKHLHRQAENALLRMENFTTLARFVTGYTPNEAFIRQGWENLMFNEFHDIMGGCCLPEALQDVEMQLSEAISIADREENAALQSISWKVDTSRKMPSGSCGEISVPRSKEEDWKLWGIRGQGTPVVVFNPHAFEATGSVVIRRPLQYVENYKGEKVPVQQIRASRTNGPDKWDAIFRARVPAMGYALYWVYLESDPHENTNENTNKNTNDKTHEYAREEKPENSLKVSQSVLENAFIRAEFDPETGALCHLIHKESNLDVLKGASGVELRDITHCDTWAHMIFRFDKPAGAFTGSAPVVTENGPVRASLCVRMHYCESTMDITYTLYADANQLDMQIRLNMHMAQKHRMVKMCWPVKGTYDVAEIPYGVLERTGCGNEEHCQRWVAIQGTEGGLAVLNDGKYSYSAENGVLCQTVANTSICADHYGQSERDASCTYMDMGEQRFFLSLVPYSGSWRSADLERRAACHNRRLPSVTETYHEGPLGPVYEGLVVDNPSVCLGACKIAEDHRGLVLRMAETTGCPAENVGIHIPMLHREFSRSFGPYECQTVYIPFEDKEETGVRDVLITENPL